MANAVYVVPSVLVVFCVAFYLPLSLTASAAAGCLLSAALWWLFSSYRDVLKVEKVFGPTVKPNMSSSGLFDGLSPRTNSYVDGKTGSPEARRFHRPLVGGSTNFGSPYRKAGSYDRANESVDLAYRSKTPVVASPVSPMSSSGLLDGLSGGACPISSPSSRLNASSGRLNDSHPAERSFWRVNKPQVETPVSSPSVSPMYRSSNETNSFDKSFMSPSLPPGSYPWIAPQGNKSGIEVVPVKMRLSKPSFCFAASTPEEPPKADKTKEIIQALKALSKKRVHNSLNESDESRDQQQRQLQEVVAKRRHAEVYHSLRGSSFSGSSESALACNFSSPTREDTNHSAHHLDSPLSPHNATPQHQNLPSPRQQQLPYNAVLSNKRPRAAEDSGNQTAKKRHNNAIFASLSSSVNLLYPQLVQGSLKRKSQKEDIQSVKQKKQRPKETTCAEVQTLPSPSPQDDRSRDKEDKGTATDKVSDDNSHETKRNKTVVPEKKVTANMAAALLRSAMIKLASSGDVIPADTSQTDGGNSEPSKENESDTEKAAEAPKAGFNFGSTATTSSDTAGSQVGSLFKFGGSSAAEPTSASAAATVSSPTPSTTSAPASGFTLAGFPKPPTSNGFAFGAGSAAKEGAPKNEPKPSEPTPVSQNVTSVAPKSGGFSFGVTTSAATVPLASETPSTTAGLGFTFGQNTSSASSTASTVQSSSSAPPAITFGQTQPASTTSSTQGQATPTIIFGQQPKSGGFSLGQTTPTVTTTPPVTSSQPGGFSFTPSVSFSMGSSPTSTSASTSSAPIFSLGSSGLSQKQDSANSLFGMPRPATSAPSVTASQPPKAVGGFNFTASSATSQNPEQKKTEGFSGFGQNSESSKIVSFGSSAGTTDPAKAGTPFLFGASSQASAPVTTAASTPAFNAPAATSSSLFGSTSSPSISFGSATPKPTLGFGTSTTTSFGTGSSGFGATPSFGSAATTQASGFGVSSATQATAFGGSTTITPASGASSTTTPAFGAPSTTQATGFGGSTTTPAFGASSTPTPAFGAPATSSAFGAATTQSLSFGTTTTVFGSTASSFGAPTTTAASSFGSATPAFGSSAPAFGSTRPAFSSSSSFGSGSTAFGSTQPTFGSVASTSTPTSAFVSSPATTTSSLFGGSGAFGAPSFGSSSTATPAFGAPQTSSAPAFGASQPTPAFGASTSAPPAFGAPQTTSAPTFGSSSTAGPFSFTAPTTPASGGFNFTAPQPAAPSTNMFSFGAAASATPQAGAQQPFAFGGAQTPTPGGFQNTMFSIGSGSSAPRSRTALRTRKK